MPRPLRIAFARLFHEACVASPLPTTLDNFERVLLLRGQDALDSLRWDRWEIPGLIPYAELGGLARAASKAGDVTLVPLLSALAVPSGKITAATWDTLTGELLQRLADAGPVDGVFLALHGSMRVKGVPGSPEAELVRRVKQVAPGAKVAVTLDLHANLTADLVAAADVIQSFRANPHWDLFPTGLRAGRTLIRLLRDEVRPATAWRKLPVVLGGGAGISLFGPAKAVFDRMKQQHRRHAALLHTSFNMVHPFSDADDIGWTVHVMTDGDPDLAARLADDLADAAWTLREAPLPPFLSLDDALDAVRTRPLVHRPFPSTVMDMGDGVLSGASGGSTWVLSRLTARPAGLRSLIPLHDPALVEAALTAGAGASVTHDAVGTPGLGQDPVPVSGTVRGIARDTACGDTAWLDLGEIQLVASTQPPLSAHPRYFREVGLDPRRADLILQKSFFQYRILYAGISHHHIPLASPGPTDLHAAARRPLPQPTWPSHDVPDWRPFDRIMRG